MEFLFGKGNKFFAFATKMAELMWINLLTILCSLPVITIGSSLSAMHRVLVDIYRDEEKRITATFFKAFKENFWQATKVWLIYLLYFGVLLVDDFALRALNNDSIGYLKLLVPVLSFIGMLSLSWAFVLQSRYNLSTKDVLAYSFTRIVAFPVRTLFMGIGMLVPLGLIMFLPQFFILIPLMGVSGVGILNTCFYNGALKVMEDDGEEDKSEEK